MLINNELKNNENDTPGPLIDKFDNSGKVRVRAKATMSLELSLDFYVENKDLFGHLLKPSVPFNISLVDVRQNFGGHACVVCPCVFPDGIINSITLPNTTSDNIEDFEIAAYGNTKNQFTGSKRWFYCRRSDFNATETGTYTYKDTTKIMSIAPYSYNFICIKMKGLELPCKLVNGDAATSLMNADIQYNFYANMVNLEEITEDVVRGKFETTHIPYFQLDILKGL